jgi:fibronectin-binding autotransporter adhesin
MLSNRNRLWVSFATALGAVALVLWLLPGRLEEVQSVAYAAGTRYVAPGGNCDGPIPCYAGVQAALDAANPGDEIRVATGTYSGVQSRANITEHAFISKTLTVQGGYTTSNWTTPDATANPTTLDAQDQGVVLVIMGNISPTVSGLRITGGYANGGGAGTDSGGGIYLISATAVLTGNNIFGNKAANGGGIFLAFSTATLISNTIANNTGDGFNARGGGVYLASSPATLRDNLISANLNPSGDGGGLYLNGSNATLNSNTIVSNTAVHGNGLYLNNSPAHVSGNTISFNSGVGVSGGGAFLLASAATFDHNIITRNAKGAGGGLYLQASAAMLRNNLISGNSANGNSGGGVYLSASNATLSGNTIEANGADYLGGGLYAVSSSAAISGNLISDNNAASVGGIVLDSSPANMTGNVIRNNSGFAGGGGVLLLSSGGTLNANVISGNFCYGSCSAGGGGLILKGGSVILQNNVVSDNRIDATGPSAAGAAGGIALLSGDAHFIHTTLARNSGGDGSGLEIAASARVTLTNTIVVSQAVGISVTAGSTATLDGVLWFANGTNIAGTGTVLASNQYTGTPAFAADGYHLTAGSAAIDKGLDAGVSTDIDGQPRPDGDAPDLGADEYYLLDRSVFLPAVFR